MINNHQNLNASRVLSHCADRKKLPVKCINMKELEVTEQFFLFLELFDVLKLVRIRKFSRIF